VSCHKSKRKDFQPFPENGILKRNSNLCKTKLNDLINQSGLLKSNTSSCVYCYIIKSVKNIDGSLQQKGCAPNWQGGIITLCTCKHFMRTFLETADWKGKWIAGFTSVNDGVDKKNALVYLMQVKDAFESHFDLWDNLPANTRKVKSAHENVLGDVFEPQKTLAIMDRNSHFTYCPPHGSHAHIKENSWHQDIEYRRNNRNAALLVGDTENSFLWDKPHVVANNQLSRGQKKMSLKDFFDSIQSVT
jgi:hypothetical protein